MGHISLDSENEDPNAADPSRGIYQISTFYISTALQSAGLGSATMDKIESLATAQPLNAKTLTLGTAAKEYPDKQANWELLKADGKEQPKVCYILIGIWLRARVALLMGDLVQQPGLVCEEGL